MAVQINYNGSVIADLSAGQTATLNCKDKVMRSNVVVTAPESMGGGDSPAEEWFNDGKTHLWIELTEEGRMKVQVIFQQTISNGVTVDWGDGSDLETENGTGNISMFHTYANIGKYVVTLDETEGCVLTLGASTPDVSVTGSKTNAYRCILRAVEIGDRVEKLGYCTFMNCYCLERVKINSNVKDFYAYSGFSCCYSLKNIDIPEGVTTIGPQLFFNCYILSKIILPESLITIGQGAFSGCMTLASMVIPSGVTSIGNSAFNACSKMKFLDFTKHTSVPTLAGSSVFNGVASDLEIRVPLPLVDEWKSATNWSNYANKIIGV